MEIAIFDRPEDKKEKIGVFYEEGGIVKFRNSGSNTPVSDEEFDNLWGNFYLHRISRKLISKSNPKEYLKGLLDRFVGRVWAEKVA